MFAIRNLDILFMLCAIEREVNKWSQRSSAWHVYKWEERVEAGICRLATSDVVIDAC